jgi:hypothetical protein
VKKLVSDASASYLISRMPSLISERRSNWRMTGILTNQCISRTSVVAN